LVSPAPDRQVDAQSHAVDVAPPTTHELATTGHATVDVKRCVPIAISVGKPPQAELVVSGPASVAYERPVPVDVQRPVPVDVQRRVQLDDRAVTVADNSLITKGKPPTGFKRAFSVIKKKVLSTSKSPFKPNESASALPPPGPSSSMRRPPPRAVAPSMIVRTQSQRMTLPRALNIVPASSSSRLPPSSSSSRPPSGYGSRPESAMSTRPLSRAPSSSSVASSGYGRESTDRSRPVPKATTGALSPPTVTRWQSRVSRAPPPSSACRPSRRATSEVEKDGEREFVRHVPLSQCLPTPKQNVPRAHIPQMSP